MFGTLLKKQFFEVFRSYLYDAKKNKARSKGAVILRFAGFALLMLGIIGGLFTYLSITLCGALAQAGMDFLYFVIMGGISIVFGAFGSVFNTYSSLYLAKDNDLLLSMPIPVKHIIASRLANVYLLGSMYALIAILPAIIVYLAVTGFSVMKLICGILLCVIITTLVMVISCLLGYVVARISIKVKRKSFVTTLASLAFIGLYYFFYFKAQSLIQQLLTNAALYGEKVKGAADWLYRFGLVGTGDIKSALIFTVLSALLMLLAWMILKRSFVSIATSSGKSAVRKYNVGKNAQKSVARTLLSKELARFTSSATYMLNTGLGLLFIPACAVLLFIYSDKIVLLLNEVFGSGITGILLSALVCMLATLNNMALPSVSLESRCLWIVKSLPLSAKQILRAKTGLQLTLTALPMLLAVICLAVIADAPLLTTLLMCLVPALYTVFQAVLCSALGVLMPVLNWTNEVVPIKQSGGILIQLFGSWGVVAAYGALYFLVGKYLSTELYLAIWAALFAISTPLMQYWLDTRGARRFEEL